MLLVPGSTLEALWRLNPVARAGFLSMGPWAVVLLLVVAGACALSALGLWRCAPWGCRLARALLAVNLIADVANAGVSGEPRTLIGVPVAGAMIAYLLSPKVRARFGAHARQ
jgi:hypothetical protein